MRRSAGRENRQPEFVQNESFIGMKAAQFDFPIVWVDANFLKCLLRSDPPPDYPLADLHWPFPAIAFVLPEKTIVHPLDGDCSWLLIGKIEGTHTCPITGDVFPVRNSVISVSSAPWNQPSPPTFKYGIENDPSLTPFREIPTYTGNQVEYFDSPSPRIIPDALTADDAQIQQLLVQLGLRLLLALTARPEYLAAAGVPKFVRQKSGRPREFIQPRWLGRNHRIHVDSSADIHDGHVRLHWRRGHFKQQAHGPGRSLRKTIWIEPYLAGEVDG